MKKAFKNYLQKKLLILSMFTKLNIHSQNYDIDWARKYGGTGYYLLSNFHRYYYLVIKSLPMKKLLYSIVLLSFMISSEAQTYYFSDDFTGGDMTQWATIDADGDGNNWAPANTAAMNGDCLNSDSWTNALGDLTPDNYLTTTIPVSLPFASNLSLKFRVGTFQVNGIFINDRYSVYLSSSNDTTSILGGNLLYDGLLSDVMAADQLNGSTSFYIHDIDLSAFQGQSMYLTFRHWNTFGDNSVLIGDVSISSSVAILDSLNVDICSGYSSLNFTGDIGNSYSIDWGDGSPLETITSSPTFHTYSTTGSHDVFFYASDTLYSDTLVETVIIPANACDAAFNIIDSSYCDSIFIVFDNTTYSTNNVYYNWNIPGLVSNNYYESDNDLYALDFTPGTYDITLSMYSDSAMTILIDSVTHSYTFTHDTCYSINGAVYVDNNGNCIYDSVDTSLSNLVIEANSLMVSYNSYGLTNNQGWFNIEAEPIPYNVTFVNSFPYLNASTCSQDTQLITLSSSNINDTINFFLTPSVLCPYMEVDISTPLLRRCFSSNYYISYCNNGTDIAQNAFIEVEFDPILQINSSSIPWSTINGSTYTFPIGDVGVFECESFSVSVSVPCDSNTFLGQVLCAEAHIYPDSLCLPSTNTWNGAELDATAECIGTDTIEFILKNIGTGNMNNDVPVIVIEDVILIMDTNVILNAGQEIKWKFPTNGISTHRMVAQQPIDHPYKTFTTDAVSLCNTSILNSPGPIIDTTTISYPNDEESPFVSIDCQPIIGSYDPNDKTVYPSGVGANHFITETTDLEYKIRFQNTGTDTAFTVVITDSISNLLDLSTFSAGASSHSYTYNIYGTGVIDFTFNNILLPDSFVNEPASNGFVQYKIEQKAGNQAGDIIYNNADIFFDFNLPVRTNTTFSEIGGIVLDTLIYKFPIEENPNGINGLNSFKINVYPNPAKEQITFELGETIDNISIELFNIEGKMQQKSIGVNANKLTIQRASLARGMYLFKIYTDEKEIAYGKLIFE